MTFAMRAVERRLQGWLGKSLLNLAWRGVQQTENCQLEMNRQEKLQKHEKLWEESLKWNFKSSNKSSPKAPTTTWSANPRDSIQRALNKAEIDSLQNHYEESKRLVVSITVKSQAFAVSSNKWKLFRKGKKSTRCEKLLRRWKFFLLAEA